VQLERPANRVVVLFGATGDLAARRLLPGLYRLYHEGLMPADFRIIGSGRHAPVSDDAFRARVREAIAKFADVPLDSLWDEFEETLSFVASDASDGTALAAAVNEAEREIGAEGARLIYLAVPPEAMAGMVTMLGDTGLANNCALVVEKPFGHDVSSAKELNGVLHRVLAEESIYRIDHFLGKEAAQNILALRFANGLLEPIWNRDHISYVQIDVPEKLTIEGRSNFYEQTGAFRDMVVTHLLQLLGVVALDPPARLTADSLHIERTKLFDAIRPLDPGRAVFGQYAGYREEPGVAADSDVETFVALEVCIDSWRWSGVPFYLRTGKALAASHRTITIGFKEAPLTIFADLDPKHHCRPSELVFELSDDPTLTMELQAKIPGPKLTVGRAALTLDVQKAFGESVPLEAYERLLHDVMIGDHLLFTRSEQIERLWEISERLQQGPPAPVSYERGSWGPDEALRLPGRHGWRLGDSVMQPSEVLRADLAYIPD
jgi:glucose-6-phosphate 1-dehydrogenase